ncbi:MAG: DUF2752 domain-containing protein [Oscillospiraceae bacterium]|nr:DUF2752 domain-containing protein [Oscillospiraceae bacterium]
MRKTAKPAVFLGIYMLLCQLVTGTICIMESSVGIPCPGCGLTRAWRSCAQMNYAAAFRWHPLFWLIPCMALLWLGAHLYYRKKAESPRWFRHCLVGCFVLFVSVYAVRMVLFFPHTAPMVTNPDSFARRILRAFAGWLG